MANSETRPDFEQISQFKSVKKMTPREIINEARQDDGEADEAKPMSFPAEGKMPGAKKLDKVGLDKAEQFRLQDEIDKMREEMEKQIEIISKLWARDKDQSKAEKQKEKIKEKFEPRIAELQNKLSEKNGERENIETLLPQLKKQAEESETKRITKMSRLQKIAITPELKEERRNAAQKELEESNAKLVDAEDMLAEAIAKRSNVLMRLFRGKNDSREIDYQQALKAVEEAKKGVAQTEESATRFETPAGSKTKRTGMIRVGVQTPSGYTSFHSRTEITGEQRKAEVRPSQPSVEKPSPKKIAIQTGEHKIIFKPEPTKPERKVEVNLPPVQESEPEISPEAVFDAEKQMENYIKNMIFKQEDSGELILKNAALMERLADANFQGDARTLNKAILDTKEEMLKIYKLKLEEQLKLEGAKFDDLAEGGKLAKRLKDIFKKQPENYSQFLALEDLFEANTSTVGRAPKRPTRPAPPVFRNW